LRIDVVVEKVFRTRVIACFFEKQDVASTFTGAQYHPAMMSARRLLVVMKHTHGVRRIAPSAAIVGIVLDTLH
jgi:hypothetical protein